MSASRPPVRRAPVRRSLLAVIGFYSRAISPALPPRCRFYPTCSAYAAEAIVRHGALRGSGLALRRLLKCAPWHPGGVDPVPGSERSPGTRSDGHSSSTAAPSLTGDVPVRPPDRAATRPPDRAPAQDHRRANEESSVA